TVFALFCRQLFPLSSTHFFAFRFHNRLQSSRCAFHKSSTNSCLPVGSREYLQYCIDNCKPKEVTVRSFSVFYPATFGIMAQWECNTKLFLCHIVPHFVKWFSYYSVTNVNYPNSCGCVLVWCLYPTYLIQYCKGNQNLWFASAQCCNAWQVGKGTDKNPFPFSDKPVRIVLFSV